MTLKELDSVATGIDYDTLLQHLVGVHPDDPAFGGDYDAYDDAFAEALAALRRDNPNPRDIVLRELGDMTVLDVRPYDDQIAVRLRRPA